MPNTRRTGTRAARTQQADPKPIEATPTSAPAEKSNDQSLFDDADPAPPAAETTVVETAASDEPAAEDRPEGVDGADGDQTPPAPVPDELATPPEPEPAPPPVEEPKAPEPVADAGEDKAAETTVEQPSVAPTEIRLGQAVGLLHRMPLGDVLAYADQFAEKIEAMKLSAPVQALLPRMRVTEGRCAPIYFTSDDDGEPEFLLAGDDALSAAKEAGLEQVFVVTIHPDDAGVVQGYLAQKASTASASTEDDELVWRANGYHAD